MRPRRTILLATGTVRVVRVRYDQTLASRPPDDGAESVVLRGLRRLPGTETLGHVTRQSTMLTVNTERFDSTEHLIGMAYCFFSTRI